MFTVDIVVDEVSMLKSSSSRLCVFLITKLDEPHAVAVKEKRRWNIWKQATYTWLYLAIDIIDYVNVYVVYDIYDLADIQPTGNGRWTNMCA